MAFLRLQLDEMTKSGPAYFWDNFRLQAILLVGIAVAMYSHTFLMDFGYALDDGLVISENPYTTQGVAGISDLLSKDAYQWYYDQFGGEAELSGGRYRPLSIITFAIEYELFGLAPRLSHFINVVLYGLTAFLLLQLLHFHWLDRRRGLAFVVVLLFLVHPLHAEVVANIKSRDEILSFLFLTGVCIQLFRYLKGRATALWWALLLYALALLSKENGITYLAILPLAMIFFARQSWQEALKKTVPFIAVAAGYLLLRGEVVGWGSGKMDDILNDPFLYASVGERYATIFVVLLKYLQLLVWPHPMSYDYGFATFAYATFSDPKVWVSLLLHVGGGILALVLWRRQAALAFGILFYLITLSIISNLIVPLGATMGERLIYHSSFGFVLVVSCLLWRVFQQPKQPTPLITAVLVVLTVAGAYGGSSRALDWQNNATLFLTDVETVPRSIKAHTAAGNEYINKYLGNGQQDTQLLGQALYHFHRAEALYPAGRVDSFDRELFLYNNYNNQGYIHLTLGQLDSAALAWQKAKSIKPFHAKIQENYKALGAAYYRRANELAMQNNLPGAIDYYYLAVEYRPEESSYWYNLGGALYTEQRYAEARAAFEQTIQLNPNNQQARQGLNAVNQILGN